jgi:hypothetical protein
MHCTLDSTSANWENRIAGLVRAFVNSKPLTTEREHFGHEWHPVELAIAVERSKNLIFAANLDPVAHPQF